MIRIITFAALAAVLGGSAASAARAQSTSSMLSTPAKFDLNTLQCHDLLDASLTNRGYAMMLYWGYEAGKSGTTKFVTATVRSQSQKLTDYCAEHPKVLIFDAIKSVAK